MRLRHMLDHYKQRTESQLNQFLLHSSIDPVLQEAMRYGLFNGGKRVRPSLVYITNEILEGHVDAADRAACAIECIHSYSLVHDDLPAMDNDDLRRGKPTCHIAYDEATAILAGDALQCFAFELLSQETTHPSQQLAMIQVLARASGDKGMCAGQSFDLRNVNKPLTLAQLEEMHRCKTGALINASLELGYLASGYQDEKIRHALQLYGDAIGLAFQVKDDILDVEGDTATLGKPQGSDVDQNKPTYPALLGMDAAKAKLQSLHSQAHDALSPLHKKGEPLKAMADFICQRSH
ncbi:polyprenyl synthetase family protein [Neptunomonas phycophila]|uniref:polyprenyl synthetase family protein n=1 Tax=Neptunomonas phycophila TaxID=1572645 RepID=UPI00373539EB